MYFLRQNHRNERCCEPLNVRFPKHVLLALDTKDALSTSIFDGFDAKDIEDSVVPKFKKLVACSNFEMVRTSHQSPFLTKIIRIVHENCSFGNGEFITSTPILTKMTHIVHQN